MFNFYGFIEVMVNVSLVWVVEYVWLIIGCVLVNVDLYVVDGFGCCKICGVSGELWIGGVGVVCGYVGDVGEVVGCFFEEGWLGSGCLYCSGDLVCWCVDGCLEFFGWIDE